MGGDKEKGFKKIILFLSGAFFLALPFWTSGVNAQAAPQFLVSWQAKNYAPYWYQGKILPAKGSLVKVSFELIDQESIADISKSRVRWYVNDQLIKNEKNGLGIRAVQFVMPDYAKFETEVRITVLDYKNSTQLDKVIVIPSVAPEIALLAPPAGLTAGKNVFEAVPFFFNIRGISDLVFSWKADNETASGNSSVFSLDLDSKMPSGSGVIISATAQNRLKSLEFADKTIQLKLK